MCLLRMGDFNLWTFFRFAILCSYPLNVVMKKQNKNKHSIRICRKYPVLILTYDFVLKHFCIRSTDLNTIMENANENPLKAFLFSFNCDYGEIFCFMILLCYYFFDICIHIGICYVRKNENLAY